MFLLSVQHRDITVSRVSCFYGTLSSSCYLLLTEIHVESQVTEFINVRLHACFGVVTLSSGGEEREEEEVSVKEESSHLTDKHQKANFEKIINL